MGVKKETKVEVKVKDVMSIPAVTAPIDETADGLARLMVEKDVDSVVVVDVQGNPMGIVTEKDLVKSVVAKNEPPNKVKASNIMSKPLFTVNQEEDVTEVAKKMRRLGVRRFPVMSAGKLVGVVSSKDILEITPTLMEVIMERSEAFPIKVKEELLTGSCDLCGNWSENLKLHEGTFLCEDCLADLKKE